MRNLEDFIYKEAAIPLDTCDTLVTMISKNKAEWIPHEYAKDGNYALDKDNLFEIKYSFEHEAIVLQQFLINTVSNYNKMLAETMSFDKYISFSGVQSCSPIRFNRCNEGSKIETHHDHVKGLFGEGDQGVPLLSIVGLLNNDFDGGKFTFGTDFDPDLKKGDIIIFPSTFLYPHSVSTVTKGSRYSFVTWAY